MEKKHQKKGQRLADDPFAQRESLNYTNPIPSREYILTILEQRGSPATHPQLLKLLELDADEQSEALSRRLRAMARDGQLVCNRKGGYGLLKKMDLAYGTVAAARDGSGRLIPDAGGEELYLSAQEMRAVFHGDKILARRGRRGRGQRIEANIVEILERNTTKVVGRFFRESGLALLEPANRRLNQNIVIPDQEIGGAEVGQMVEVEVTEQPTRRSPARGRVIAILGEHMAPGLEIDVAIRAYHLPYEWPQEVLDEIHGWDAGLPPIDSEGPRKDYRALTFVTIDGEDAKDFDDAVYCSARDKGGWNLWVAIADVSHYVLPDTALDREAYRRGNSVYFPGRVLPMLPEILSNGLCSLNPLVDRLTMVCEMSISEKGNVERYRFHKAIIHSRARLTYTQVAAWLAGKNPEAKAQTALLPDLKTLEACYHALYKARQIRGAIEFDTVETQIIFGDDKKIKKIVPVRRNEAHKLIEECMLAANVSVAKYLLQHENPALYRIHKEPSAEKLEDLRVFLNGLGLSLSGGKKPRPIHFSKLIQEIQGRPDAMMIQTVMLRSMSQAVYSNENVGHFGLAYKAYTHFTSPIRRYPDLLVHRAIEYLLQPSSLKMASYEKTEMQKMGEHCSMRERRADEATRDVTDWLKCEYMLDELGKVYNGTISGVTGFGCFVELTDIYVEGLVHITALPNDYYHYEPTRMRLVGERSGKSFRLGDPMRVRVVRVDLDERQIDFELA